MQYICKIYTLIFHLFTARGVVQISVDGAKIYEYDKN